MSIDLSGVEVVIATITNNEPISISGSAPVVAVINELTSDAAIVITNVATWVPDSLKPLLMDLSGVLQLIVVDLSGVHVDAVSLLRHIPRLAAHVHALTISNDDKRALVIGAAHTLIDRLVPSAEVKTAHTMVDAVFPAAIAAVIDVVRGRVSFGVAAQALVSSAAPVVIEVAQRECIPRLLECFRASHRK